MKYTVNIQVLIDVVNDEQSIESTIQSLQNCLDNNDYLWEKINDTLYEELNESVFQELPNAQERYVNIIQSTVGNVFKLETESQEINN